MLEFERGSKEEDEWFGLLGSGRCEKQGVIFIDQEEGFHVWKFPQ